MRAWLPKMLVAAGAFLEFHGFAAVEYQGILGIILVRRLAVHVNRAQIAGIQNHMTVPPAWRDNQLQGIPIRAGKRTRWCLSAAREIFVTGIQAAGTARKGVVHAPGKRQSLSEPARREGRFRAIHCVRNGIVRHGGEPAWILPAANKAAGVR